MEFGPDKVTVSEADPRLRDRVVRILTDAGYQVSAEPAATLKTVLDFMPDVIVMGASPPQLDCCDLLADVKGSEQARHIRVIMMAAGGSAERVRGRGANDVLSPPLEDRELLARVRAQLRDDRQSHQQARRIPPLQQGMHSLRLGIVVLAALTACFSRRRLEKSISSAAPTRTFFGSQPRSAHVPSNGRESITATSHPAARHLEATVEPAVPLPTTTESNFSCTYLLSPSGWHRPRSPILACAASR